ncbi:MAG: lipopolysaccharide transport periplasmic protein LptA [Gallionella sp.]
MQSNKISAMLLMLLATSASWAEQNDRNQPMQIESDQAEMNQAAQISTFTGKVQINQGTMQILGDKLVVTQDKLGNKIGKIYGALASFRQKREGLDEYDEGYGERIEYDTLKQTLDIYGQARLKRNQDFVRGDHINYNSQTEIFVVSNNAPSNGEAPHRVKAIIQPQPKTQPASAVTEKK